MVIKRENVKQIEIKVRDHKIYVLDVQKRLTCETIMNDLKKEILRLITKSHCINSSL